MLGHVQTLSLSVALDFTFALCACSEMSLQISLHMMEKKTWALTSQGLGRALFKMRPQLDFSLSWQNLFLVRRTFQKNFLEERFRRTFEKNLFRA